MRNPDIMKIYDENRMLHTVTVEVNNHCNWRCKHCYLDDKNISLEPQKIFEIIDDARKLGAFELKLSGGEVTLYPQLEKIITYARKKYLNVILLSNMSMLSEPVFSCIQKYGITGVEVTLFSLRDSIHDEFVGSKGALQRSLKNIQKLKNLGIDILVKTWAIKSNFHELESMREYFESHGYRFSVDVQIYSDINGIMKLPKEEQLSEKEYCHALYLQDSTRQFPIDISTNTRLCDDFSTSIYITASGDIIPCAKYRKPLANIHHETLRSVWESSLLLHQIQNYCLEDCEGCKNCNIKNYCVRCGAMAFIKGFDFLDNCEETCILAKIRASNYTSVLGGKIY